MSYRDKKIAVLGLGSSGKAAARLLLSEGARVTLLDSGSAASLQSAAEEFPDAQVITGPEAEHVAPLFDLAVISPGIDPASKLVGNLIGVPLISEIELGFEFATAPVIAITGTNGKTTTTGLVSAMLEAAGYQAPPCGNYGQPLCDVLRQSTPVDFFVVEVSSFQLEAIRSFRPRVSVWLNFAADHLDRYPDMESYRAAKLRIFKNQTLTDSAVVNARDELPELPAQRITFDALNTGADFALAGTVISFHGEPVLDMRSTQLSGTHNAENLMAALGVAHALALPMEKVLPGLQSFRAKAHRCELVAEEDGVQFVNDSKATNLDALEKALIGQQRPVVLIAGGKDKGFGFASLKTLVGERCRAAVLIGEMSSQIASQWSDALPCHNAGSLADAVRLAQSLAVSGDVVLFSPGTSSFDMFRNYEDRGDQFRALVHNNQTQNNSL